MRKNTVLMLAIRGISILLSLISAPIMLHHVDRADYGVLLTLTSMVAWVSMMDIGVGNGLRNKIPAYLAQGDNLKAKEAVSSCYGILSIYVFILILIFISVSPFIDWLNVLNSTTSDASTIMALANVVFVAFCINFVFGLLNSVLFAYQMPAFQSIFTLAGQIISIIALVVQVYVFDVTSVFQIGAVNCLVCPLILFLGSLFLYRTKLKEVAPSLKLVNFKSVNGVLSLGLKFFVLQIITIVLFQANNIIITRAVGPEAVVEYSLAFKYISVLTMVFNIAVTPIWSATTDAYVRMDLDWIKKTVRYLRKVFLVTLVLGSIMVLLSKTAFNLWLGNGTIDIRFSTTALVFLYISFEMLYKVYGTILNGTGKTFAQMVITSAIAIVYIPTALLLGKLWGLSGVLIANTIVFLLNYLWSKIQYNKIISGTAKGFWNK